MENEIQGKQFDQGLIDKLDLSSYNKFLVTKTPNF